MQEVLVENNDHHVSWVVIEKKYKSVKCKTIEQSFDLTDWQCFVVLQLDKTGKFCVIVCDEIKF